MGNEIWVAAGTIIGAALATYAAHRRARLEQKRETERVVKELKQHTSTQVKRANGVPWSFIENCPLPTWCKDVNGTMVWINNEYEQQWGIKSSMYEGRTDFDVWPADIAAAFRRHDQLVIAQKHTLVTVEAVPDRLNDPNSPRREWRIWKFPVVNNTGDVVAVGGIAAIVDFDASASSLPIIDASDSDELWSVDTDEGVE